MTDLAKIVIESQDRSASGFASATANMQALGSAAGNLRGTLAGIFTGGVIGGLVAMTLRATEAADQMEKMSQKVGIPVGELSKLKWAASQADVSFEALGKGIKALAKNMVEAGDATSKSGKLMAAIGVDLSKGVDPALESIAAAFAKMPDGVTKSTLAVELFGKAGLDMIPLLNGGAAGLRKMKDEAVRLGLVMDETTTKASEQFNDNLKVLRARSEALAITMTNSMAPGLVRITEAMKIAASESGVLRTLWIGLGGIAAEFIGLNDSALVKTGIRIREINNELERYQAIEARAKEVNNGSGKRMPASILVVQDRIKDLKEELRLSEQLRTAQQGGFEDQATRAARQGKATAGGIDSGFEARLKGILSSGSAGKDKVDEYAKVLEDANKRIAATYAETLDPLTTLTSAEKKLAELRASDVWATFTTQQRITLRLKLEEAAANEKTTASQKEAIKAVAEYNKLVDNFREKQEEHIRGIEEKATAINEEVANYGKLPSAIMAATVAINEQVLAQARQNDASPETIANLEKLIAAQKKYGASLANKEGHEAATKQIEASAIEQMRMWDSLTDAAGNFFGDLVVNGRSAFDNLRSSLKSLAADLIAFFAKRYLLQMVAGASGTFGGAAANAATSALGGMGNSMMGTGLSAAGSWLGSTALGTGFAAGASGFTATTAGGMAVLGTEAAGLGIASSTATGMAAVGEGIGAAYAGAMEGLAAIGPVGWIALAAIAAYAIFAQKAGGAKVGGSFQTNGATNNLFGLQAGESTGNAGVQAIAGATAKSYADLVSRFRGTDQGFNFGLAYDSDPRGTANNRIIGQVTDRLGNRVFSEQDREIGRDEKNIGPELTLTASRALLAALQASKLPGAIAGILDDVVAAGATQTEIDDVILRATAMSDVLSAFGEALGTAVAPAKTAIELIYEQGKALADFARDSDRSAQSLGTLTTATAQYRARVTELIKQYEDTRGAIGKTIDDTINAFRFGLLDRQGQYDSLQNQADSARGTLGNLSDAGAIAQAIQQIAQLSNQAFGLLSDEEKKARLEEFVAGLRDAQSVADTRLADLQQAAADAANAQLEETRKNIATERATAEMNRDTALIERETALINAGTAAAGLRIDVVGAAMNESGN